jgi:hypothetical protein
VLNANEQAGHTFGPLGFPCDLHFYLMVLDRACFGLRDPNEFQSIPLYNREGAAMLAISC